MANPKAFRAHNLLNIPIMNKRDIVACAYLPAHEVYGWGADAGAGPPFFYDGDGEEAYFQEDVFAYIRKRHLVLPNGGDDE